MTESVTLRPITTADIPTIARHRAAMFHEMHPLPAAVLAELEAATVAWLAAAVPAGEYLGWYAVAADGSVASGAGVQRRRVLPHPLGLPAAPRVAAGSQALVVNVWTEPVWRGRGLATRVMREVMAWAAGSGVDRVVLHASAAGRPLYEKLGFRGTNELRWEPVP